MPRVEGNVEDPAEQMVATKIKSAESDILEAA